MSADIRESTTLLDKATSLNHFVAVVREMIDASSQLVRREDGFFDKFLGDGFLAYWIPSDYGREMFEEERDRTTRHLVDAITLGIGMNDVFAPGLGELSHHIEGMKPTGFAVGIEVGQAAFFKIAGQWTIMGMPVVRASRLASAKENVGKTYIGRGAKDLLDEAPDGYRLPDSLRIEHGSVSTKDPGNQLEAYQVLQTE